MSSQITEVYSADWQLSLYQADELVQGAADVAQCIDIILNTQLGTDPLRPDFGTNYLDHIDKPVNVAAPGMVREIVTAISRWEKRVTINTVTWRVDEAKVTYQIEWSSKYGPGINIIAL